MINNEQKIGIKETALILGVSLDTLRRWDKNGKLVSERKGSSEYRYYSKEKIEDFLRKQDVFLLAKKWVLKKKGVEPPEIFYCRNSYVFQGRLSRLESELAKIPGWELNFSILSAIAGEIGNNSFDHNLGNWPDEPGIFFDYAMEKREIVLADRGRGVWETLKAVRPDLADDAAALKMAFTEIISGRAPESRGNGLKFVRRAVEANHLDLFFQSGSAILEMKKPKPDIKIRKSAKNFHGCLALIKF
ncbi:MAG: MerR family transcriptional regulator [Patescibacteria group bacterium]|nr:MerR family transcriptional regulator [Patescibacteria group bacterium]